MFLRLSILNPVCKASICKSLTIVLRHPAMDHLQSCVRQSSFAHYQNTLIRSIRMCFLIVRTADSIHGKTIGSAPALFYLQRRE